MKRRSPPNDPQRRSCCPVACTLDLIGDRWTLLVVRDLFAGRTRFAEFARSPEGIASNILAQRLDALVAAGLVERRAEAGEGHPRYHLTARGQSLRPVLEAMHAWGLEHIEGTEARVRVPPAATSAGQALASARPPAAATRRIAASDGQRAVPAATSRIGRRRRQG